jgi:hypothetical protein
MTANNTAESMYRSRLVKAGVPEHMHDGYINYLLHGIEPGSFLLAVLSNDLSAAFAYADETNRNAMYQHVMFLYNAAPNACWGSVAKVLSWLEACQRSRAAIREVAND